MTHSDPPSDAAPDVAAPTPGLRLRWWPAALIVLLAAIAIPAGMYAPAYRDVAQYQSLWAQSVVGAAAILLCLWFVLASGLSGRVRATAGVLIGLAAVSAALLFRIEGVTGDLRPIITPRFRLATAAGGDTQNRAIELTTTEYDFPQFLGAQRDAVVVPHVQLEHDWIARPPETVWRQSIGEGWGGFAIVGDYAFTQEQDGSDELILCYELHTGQTVWRYRYPAEFRTVIAGSGPRATPTIVGDHLYAIGATGLLHCLDARDGSLHWSRDTLADAGAENRQWGVACSPLVVDQQVIVSSGGSDGWSLVAYDIDSGEVAWRGGDAPAGYASPILVTLAGKSQILIVNARSVAAHDPHDGHVLWEYPWGQDNPVCANPIIIGDDRLFLSAGYGYGCVLLKLERDDDGEFAVSEVWPRNRNMKLKFNNGVEREGFIYGLDDGVLCCLDLANGRRRWKAGRYGHGQLLLVGDLLLVQAETGELVLVRATPERHEELASQPALGDKTWNNLALSGPLLLVRNSKEAHCLRLPTIE